MTTPHKHPTVPPLIALEPVAIGTEAPPEQIGGYAIAEKLRDGGMASLFLATRSGAHGFSRPVAIKVMHPHVALQPRMTQMFVDEALLGSTLQHPNIVHVEAFGEEDGRYYLVMEYIDGCSLSDVRRFVRKREAPIDPRFAVSIAEQAARGLHQAHETTNSDGEPLGVVHRDISPGNILVSRDGHVKLIDFGIAKSEFRAEHTIASLKGKFRYMSPEQARGQDLDRRSDTYSLALILWELLSNRRALEGKSDLAILEIARAPELPKLIDFGVAEELAKVVDKALAIDPDERFATALEFAQALRAAVPEINTLESHQLGAFIREIPVSAPTHGTFSSSLSQRGSDSLSISRSRRSSRAAAPPEIPIAFEDPSTGDASKQEDDRKKRLLFMLGAAAAAILVLLVVVLRAGPVDEPALPSASISPLSPALPTPVAPLAPVTPPGTASALGGPAVDPAPVAAAPVAAGSPAAALNPPPPPTSATPGGVARGEARLSQEARLGREDGRVEASEPVVRTRGDSQPERVGGVLLDTGGEDRTRDPQAGPNTVSAGGTLLAN